MKPMNRKIRIRMSGQTTRVALQIVRLNRVPVEEDAKPFAKAFCMLDRPQHLTYRPRLRRQSG